jgi:hypothetical protein
MKPLLFILALLSPLPFALGSGDPSKFSDEPEARDPFSSIDESTGTTGTVTPLFHAAAASEIGPDLFKVTTISISKLSIAIINRRAFAQGDTFNLKAADNHIFEVSVSKITDGEVVLELRGQQIVAPLLRKEAKSDTERK